MTHSDAPAAQPGCVLILAAGRDGELAMKVLTQAGHACQLCASPQDLVDRLGDGISALLIAEELMSEPLHASLATALTAQPAWSDLPILVVAQNSSQPARRPGLIELGNVSVLTRPMAVDALSSSVAASIRARRRQLQVRDLLRDQQEQARRKDEFLAMLAHELRNPLAPIRYAARILQTPGLPAENLQSTAQLVERQVGHMATIIDDLLDVEGDPKQTGKAVREDLKKTTFVSFSGMQGARQLAVELCQTADRALEPFGKRADRLRELSQFVAGRSW
jgi:signal transduction histidine kinase